jgi:hypothetical protein
MKTQRAYSFLFYFFRSLKLGVLFLFPATISAQTIIYNETIGSYSGSISVAAYTGWSTPSAGYSISGGSVSITNSVIASDYPGASGGAPVRISSNSTWVISNINTTAYSNIKLSFGIHKSNKLESGSELVIEVSTDGITYTPLTWTFLPTGNGTGNSWFYRTGGIDVTGTIPSTPNLRLRFRNTGAPNYDIDDVQLFSSVALPLHLIDFSAQRINGGMQFNWITTNEDNVSHFELQRSENGTAFTTIQRVAARNTGSLEKYSASDINPINNKAYYRLVSIDRDGQASYSKLLSVSERNASQVLSLFLHPAELDLIAASAMGNYQYSIINMNGQVTGHGSVNINSGLNKLYFGARLSSGVYMVHISNGNFEQEFKTIVR